MVQPRLPIVGESIIDSAVSVKLVCGAHPEYLSLKSRELRCSFSRAEAPGEGCAVHGTAEAEPQVCTDRKSVV